MYSNVFNTPIVFISGKIPFVCKYFVLMEYINGYKLSDIVYSSKHDYGEKIFNEFLDLYISNIKLTFSNILLLNNLIFINKIESLSSELEKISFSYNEKVIINNTINLLKNYDWSYIQKSENHGDLTLENIIYYNKKFVLIDFLNCFYDSWELDVSKLLFDIRSGWSLRYNNILIDNTKIVRKEYYKITINKIFENIEKKHYCKLKNDLMHLQLLNAIRILPYAKDNISKEIIFHGLEDIIKEL